VPRRLSTASTICVGGTYRRPVFVSQFFPAGSVYVIDPPVETAMTSGVRRTVRVGEPHVATSTESSCCASVGTQ
jgi:hypothetical protein